MSISWDEKRSGMMREVSRSESAVAFEWTPIFFTMSDGLNLFYTSPEIRAMETTWFFHLYPNGDLVCQRNWIGLSLWRLNILERDVRFAIGVRLAGETEREILNYRIYPGEKYSVHVNNLVPSSEILKGGSELNLTGQLTITCKLWTGEQPTSEEKKFASRETQTEEQSDVTAREENSANLDTKVDSTLQKHLKDLLLTGDDHDVAIKVRNQEFRAHKSMLRARSPVFVAMFKHEMKESEDGSITINDCDPDAFGEFLNYVYTGKVGDLSPKKATGLYYVGDKYDFSGLKEVCVQFLEASLSTNSICDVIDLATRHDETGLLESAIKFFSENTKGILITVEWQRFAAHNIVAANELFLRAIDALGKKVNE